MMEPVGRQLLQEVQQDIFCTGVGTSSTSGLNIGGYTMPGYATAGLTEEFAAGGTVVKTITTS